MSQTNRIEIDAARFDELDAMIGLMSEAFQLPPAPAREVFYKDPYFELQNKRVLRVDGRMVSCLTIMDTTCWIGEATVRIGGVAGVATFPEERGKGYAAQLLTATLPLLRERGYPLSALFPFSIPYYRKFGWERAGDAYRYLTSPDHLPPYPQVRHVRPAHANDAPQLVALYDARTQGRTMHCLRDAKRWRYALDNVTGRVVYSPDGTRVEGYLLYEIKEALLPESPDLENIPLFKTIRIMEMRAATEEARRGLIGYLAAQRDAGCIEYDAALCDLEENRLLDLLGLELAGMCSIEKTPVLMTRVIQFEKMLQALRPNWNHWTGEVCLELHDPWLEPHESAALVKRDGGEATVRALMPSETQRFPHRLSGDVRGWSQVMTGHLAGDDACLLNVLRAAAPEAAEIAGTLFPGRAPYLPLPDHF